MYRSDTSPEVQKVYDQKIKQLTGEERFMRGLSLTHFCREICLAGIRDRNPSFNESEVRAHFFEAVYGDLFTIAEKEKILTRFRE